jgi:hypothetical protein
MPVNDLTASTGLAQPAHAEVVRPMAAAGAECKHPAGEVMAQYTPATRHHVASRSSL